MAHCLGEDDRAPRREALDERVENCGIAADVENGGIVGAFVVFRRRHFITDGAIRSRSVFLPDDRGLSAGKKRKPGKEAAKNPVADDEDAGADVVAGERMERCRGQSEQHGLFAERACERNDARSRGDEMRAASPCRPRTWPKQRAPGTKTARRFPARLRVPRR